MRRIIGLAFCVALAAVPGCWAGKTLDDKAFAHRHDSVRWVYQTGGQVAFAYWVLPMPVDNNVVAMKTAGDCLVVTEGKSFSGWAPWKKQYALLLGDGSVRKDVPPDLQMSARAPDGDLQSVRKICGNFVVYIPEPYDQLFVGTRDTPNGQLTEVARFTSSRFFSFADSYILTDDGLLLINCGRQFIVCVDTSKIQPEAKD